MLNVRVVRASCAQDDLSTTSELRRKGTGSKKKRGGKEGELASLDLARSGDAGAGKENGKQAGAGQAAAGAAVPTSTGAGGSVFMRTISNPEAVLRRRRQQKLGEKLQRIDQMEKLTAGGPQAATMGLHFELLFSIPLCANSLTK